jgi:hypothetical protein
MLYPLRRLVVDSPPTETVLTGLECDGVERNLDMVEGKGR